MAGIYLHIPFCKQACSYCNFHFSTTRNLQQQVVNAMIEELQQRSDYLQGEVVETIYFGGGTPSLLTAVQLDSLFNAIHQTYKVIEQPEITLEANPDDLDKDTLLMLLNSPVNRMSIGVQSFRDADLQFMNRAHNAVEALQCIQDAQHLGFDNITIDLIYGTPGMDMDAWQANVQQAIDLNVPHLSAYCLTVEPKTALAHKVMTLQVPDVNDALAAKQYDVLRQMTADAGFDHYEISNFAKPGYYSKHNSAYWQGKAYLGIGPGAHSYNGNSRTWNVSNNPKYIIALENGTSYNETETLSKLDQLNEQLMVGLRTSQGVDLGQLASRYGEGLVEQIKSEAEPHLASGKLQLQGQQLFLHPDARFVADSIISDLFVVE